MDFSTIDPVPFKRVEQKVERISASFVIGKSFCVQYLPSPGKLFYTNWKRCRDCDATVYAGDRIRFLVYSINPPKAKAPSAGAPLPLNRTFPVIVSRGSVIFQILPPVAFALT